MEPFTTSATYCVACGEFITGIGHWINDTGPFCSSCFQTEPAALRERVEALEYAVEYYRASIYQTRTRKRPQHVPSRVKVLMVVRSEIPGCASCVRPGVYYCHCNQWGAVSVDGLGLRLDEFDPVAWRVNEAATSGGGGG